MNRAIFTRFVRGVYTALAAVIFLVGISAASEPLYTCGMHPQIIKKEPGDCPICGMKLVPIQRTSASNPSPASARTVKYVQVDAGTRQRMNLMTAEVERGPVRREFRTVGTVTYDEQGVRDITTRFEGWIEKMFINTTWTAVTKDEPLFEMYSPDLYNAQLNWLVAWQSEGERGGPLSRAAFARLQLFDAPADLIETLKKTGQVQRTVIVRAPSDGVVIEKMAVPGQMMKPGERIYRIANLRTVWVQAQIYEKDLPFVRPGQEVTVRSSYGESRSFTGRVELLLPQVQEETRSGIARIVLPNTNGYWRPGMYVDVTFSSTLKDDAVLVPDTAVLRSGERNTVFVALDDGAFEPRDVKLGVRSRGNFYEVLDGLKAGDRVVISGQFMLDSESQLQEAIQKMLKPEEAAAIASAKSSHHDAPAFEHGPAHDAFIVLVEAAADVSTALGHDDLSAYQAKLAQVAPALHAYLEADPPAIHGPLSVYAGELKPASTLNEARTLFAPFSTAVADLAHERQIHREAGLHLFECTMAPGGAARWVQRSGDKLNPFYGSAMPDCGTEIDPTP